MPLIRETIVTTLSSEGQPHIAPFGIHVEEEGLVIAPFRPSRSLNNLMANPYAVINYIDDVRIFAGCLTHRRHWKTLPAQEISGAVLAHALSHAEVKVKRVEEDDLRPHFFCELVYEEMHAPFLGFNRAQGAVIEACILISRLDRLSQEQVEKEIDYLKIAVEKTAGPREETAWKWLMEYYDEFRQEKGWR